ncbi:MAG: hypothetical protein BWK72_10245 [Rhodoferax ferrireducens]|uniref:Uncharacterized protein n=2 Tax=Pseudomonadota TaxID=1224 RepID=A0A1Y1QYS1_9GAMM|nr:MAG: hypothetical protein BWK72_10245 [Rhodoferax ferrireducens]OQX16848.1 MAG: hypothetical protein BWK73_02625 [Thiothrix lacustris]
MLNKYVYALVMLIIMAAWFAKGPVSVPKPAIKDANQSPPLAEIKSDLNSADMKPDATEVIGKCNIEFINDVAMNVNAHDVVKNSLLKLTGWAMDDQHERLPEKVIVRFTNSANKHFYAIARTGLKRNDVRDYFRLSDRVLGAGFDLHLNTRDLPAGIYSLTLLIQFDRKTYVCDNNRKINMM